MASTNGNARRGLFAASALSWILLTVSLCGAQSESLTQNIRFESGCNVDTDLALNCAPGVLPAEGQASPTASTPNAANDDGWHIKVSPYLWFAGFHGTVGAFGRDISVHATPGDLLSHFRFGLMGLTEVRKKRVLLAGDLIWVRLGDNKALPFPNLSEINADMKGGEFLLTPEVGYRVIDQDKIKVDGLAGFRYWHFYQSVSFSPSLLGRNFSSSQNWVDPIVGGRIQGIVSPKVVVNILGDVGGWGTGSQLEYQIVGVLGYKIKPAWTLQAGYRYLDVDYRSGGTLIDIATDGAVIGVTWTIK